MVEKCAGGNEKRIAKCRTNGVRDRDCVKVFSPKFGSKNMARVICALRDVNKPYGNPKGGLMREEIEVPFEEVLRLRFGAEDQPLGGRGAMPRLLEHLVGRKYRDPRTGLVERHSSAFAKSPETAAFHEKFTEGLINVPRMRRMEARVIKNEQKIREQMRRKLQQHPGKYEHWELGRRLKSTERLRRRRVLLAFDADNHDPEETHRELRQINRRLHEISEHAAAGHDGGGSHREKLQHTARRLASEAHPEQRKLRELLEHPHYTISADHKSYVEEFRIKRTSREMRELMELTHAAKRKLTGMAEIGDRISNFVRNEDVEGLKTFIEEQSCFERKANGR